MATEPIVEYNDIDNEIAKRIFCAVLSHQMGISYQYCWKTYIEPQFGEKRINDKWLKISQKAQKIYIQHLENM